MLHILPCVPVEKRSLHFYLTVYLCVSVPIAYCLSRFTGLHVLAVFAMVQVGDILKCIVGFVLVKKGVWMQNIVSGK